MRKKTQLLSSLRLPKILRTESLSGEPTVDNVGTTADVMLHESTRCKSRGVKFRTQRLEWMCERMTNNDLLPDAAFLADDALALPLEVRVHGRGGQGGVTCAKLIAALYTQLGLHVQTFGDYGSERSGAPIQAYTRVDRQPITNRNKVYRPDHLLVLDEALLGPAVLSGTSPGALLLLNSRAAPEAFADEFADYRFGVVDATAIAREHGIGSSAVVIINTTLLGAYVRLLDMPFAALERAFAALHLSADLAAAQQAYAQVQTRMPPQGHRTRMTCIP